MNIFIQTIKHKFQRYETCGDWQRGWQGFLTGEDGAEVATRTKPSGAADILVISVSKMSDPRFELLVGIHELIEAVLCDHNEISEEAVTAFDEEFEAARLKKFPTPDGFKFYFHDTVIDADAEPGDHLDAPYYSQHQAATYIERLMARKLDVDWAAYERALNGVGDASSSST